ncbi:MAG: hypothetical protein OXH57_10750, partial [Ekhidna sp.]|nr:hypothetical protein [Ekhidna sp.]
YHKAYKEGTKGTERGLQQPLGGDLTTKNTQRDDRKRDYTALRNSSLIRYLIIIHVKLAILNKPHD